MSKDDLAKLQSIWNSWRHIVPRGEFIKKTSEGGDPDIMDDNVTVLKKQWRVNWDAWSTLKGSSRVTSIPMTPWPGCHEDTAFIGG